MSTSAQIHRFQVRAGELGVTVIDNGGNSFTLNRYNPASGNGQQSWKAQRPAPGAPPLLTSTVTGLVAAEAVLVDWTGVATINPDRA